MPIAIKSRPALHRVGVQLEGATDYNQPYLIPGSTVERQVFWYKIEEERGVLNWPSKLDADIRALESYPLVLNIKTTPTWARQYAGYVCSPPAEHYYYDYAMFVVSVIDRYHPNAVEIWNEPETHASGIDPNSPLMGCWPNRLTYFQAGKLYGEFVDYVYNIVHAYHPSVYIMAGATLLDPFSKKAEFTEGMLSTQPNYDVYSIHSYLTYPKMDYKQVLRQLDFLRRYGVDKPIWITETSLLCDGDCGGSFEKAQADYAHYIFNLDLVDHVLWYTLYGNGWRNSDLAYARMKKPAWYVYEEMLR